MTDSEIELSNESFAREQYAKAQEAFAKATRSGDLEGIEQAVELFEKAGDYFGDLADTSTARSGLTSVRDALIEVAKAEEKIKLEKNQQAQADAKADAQDKKDKAKRELDDQLTDFQEQQAKKLESALEAIQKQEEAEDRRHQKVVDNLTREREEIIKNGEEAARSQQNILNMMDQSQYAKDNVGSITRTDGQPVTKSATGVFPAEAKQETTKDVTKAVKDGFVKGASSKEAEDAVTNAVDKAGIGESISGGIQEGVQEGLFKDVLVNGMPLEEWKKLGEEQGTAAGKEMGASAAEEATSIFLAGTSEGWDVAVKMNVDPNDTDEAWKMVQERFEDTPFEIGVDRAEFDRLMQNIVSDAQRRYKIVIPVTTSQPRAEGGPVFKMNRGGRLPGQSSPYDTVDVKARPGEWFIKNESVAAWSRAVGNWFMPGVNRPNSMAGQILQGMLARGAAATSQPEFPNMGTLNITMGDRSTQIHGTPMNLKTFAAMMQDMEAYSS